MVLGGLDPSGLFMALVARIGIHIVNLSRYLWILNIPGVEFLANMAEALVAILKLALVAIIVSLVCVIG